MAPPDAVRELRLALALITEIAGGGVVGAGELADRLGLSPDDLDRLITEVGMCGLPPYSPDVLLEFDVRQGGISLRGGTPELLGSPARLTLAETEALLDALLLLGARLGPDAQGALASLCAKVEDSLGSPAHRELVEQTVGAIPGPEDDEVLATLWRAAERCRSVEIEYHSASSGAAGCRRIDPLSIASHGGVWYVAAFCHKAGEVRVFRVDRIRQATLADETFEPPAPGSPDPLEEPPRPADDEGSRAVLRFEGAAARWAIEEWGAHVTERSADGAEVTVALTYRDERWLLRKLLPHLERARVVDPAALAEAHAALVGELARRYP